MGPNITAVFGRAAGFSPVRETNMLDVEDASEVVVAPAAGASVAFTHRPLVTESLIVRDPAGTVLTLGVDYEEVPAGGLTNLALAPGASLSVDYFYHVGGVIDEIGSGGGSGEGGSDANFVFEWGVPATEIPIHHGLGKFPSVTVVDSSGSEVEVEVLYSDLDNVILRCNAQFSGVAFFN